MMPADDALKLAEEALVGMRPTSRGPGCYCPDSWDAPAATLHHARCTATRKALASLETARAEWGWRPIIGLDDSGREPFYAGKYDGSKWDINILHSRNFAAACGYTHFYRPQLPPPPAREEKEEQA